MGFLGGPLVRHASIRYRTAHPFRVFPCPSRFRGLLISRSQKYVSNVCLYSSWNVVRCFIFDHLYIGGMDPRCKICIFMGKTDPEAPKHKQQVLILGYCLISNRNVACHKKMRLSFL